MLSGGKKILSAIHGMVAVNPINEYRKINKINYIKSHLCDDIFPNAKRVENNIVT
jgi:hypothetical protein